MKNIMIDLETMGDKPNSAIIAIGAVYFDETGTGRTFYRKISLENACSFGLEMDAGTVLWWLQQSDEARKEFQDRGDPLYYVLRKFTEFMQPGCQVWGNGAGFDNVILANAFRKLNMAVPWSFYDNRCFRTLKNIFPLELPENKTKHNALADAIWQAEYASLVLQKTKTKL